MSNVLDTLVDGIKAVAPSVANFVVPGSGPLLQSMMRSVAGADPTEPIEQVAARISADPALYIELQRVALEREVSLAEIEARKLETVNQTMREEGKSEHFMQWAWRPFNGFLYPLAIIFVYFFLPLAGKPVPAVPEWIWMGWGAILGVTTWGRNQLKQSKTGQPPPGVLGAVADRIRGGASA
ncbi:MAG: hypothetical protein C0621_00145 [Desulfuromonas sp.]|nr:MAG: hypothetical protein C0621_00145 [Desulfuromonas sp.]